MSTRPKVRLRWPSSESSAGTLAAKARWSELPSEPSTDDLAAIVDTLSGYAIADDLFCADASEIARRLADRHQVSGVWAGTSAELLVALFGEVRAWRADDGRPTREDHRRAVSLFCAIQRRLKERPDEIDLVPATKRDRSIEIRTSASHPLVIGWVAAPSPWRIGITIAPGKHTTSMAGFRWARDVGADLDAIVDAGARTLVTLLEIDEMDRLGIADLLAAGRHRGLHVVHFPIADVSIPTTEATNRIVAELFERSREPLVIHCNGGLGRSGVIAGCILRAIGLPAPEALDRLRAARGAKCPETAEQRAFVAEFVFDRSVAVARSPSSRTVDPRSAARIAGCLVGGAVGDALGAPVEFSSLSEIRRRYGPTGIGELASAYGRKGAITDDTQMTLFTAEGVLRAYVRSSEKGICHPPSVILHAYLRWLCTQEETSTHSLFSAPGFPDGWLVKDKRLFSQRAPGNTCLIALKKIPEDLFATNNSKGCGGVMRVAPIGLALPAGSREHGWPAFELGVDSSRLTHGHPAGYVSGGYFAELIAQLMSGKGLRDAIDTARIPLEQRRDADAVLIAVDRAIRLAEDDEPPTPERIEMLGGGWVGDEALAIAIYCSLVARDFEHGLRLAVNHSGDSDSTGSLVGNALGALWGPEVIPRRWREEVELLDVVETIAADLASLRAGTFSTRTEWERYPGW